MSGLLPWGRGSGPVNKVTTNTTGGNIMNIIAAIIVGYAFFLLGLHLAAVIKGLIDFFKKDEE